MDILKSLLIESTNTSDVAQARPKLVGLTKAVNSLIFKDLVAEQPTDMPVATLLGVRYNNRAGEMVFTTPATYTGAMGVRPADMPTLNGGSSFTTGTLFRSNNIVYKALKDVTIALYDGNTSEEKLNSACMVGDVRLYSDAAFVDDLEYAIPVDSDLAIDRWQIESRTRKVRTRATQELLQDMNSLGIADSEDIVRDLMAVEISDEINKDVMQKLQCVSIRHTDPEFAPNSVYEIPSVVDPATGRSVYRMICDMSHQLQLDTTYKATYVLCTPRVASLLLSSGWMSGDIYMPNQPVFDKTQEKTEPDWIDQSWGLMNGWLKSGLKVYVDLFSKFDYAIVGTKHKISELQSVGSLFYTPYVSWDGAGAFTMMTNSLDLQPKYMLMARYGLSVNPYTIADGDTSQVHAGDDWDNLANRSKYSRFVGFRFG